MNKRMKHWLAAAVLPAGLAIVLFISGRSLQSVQAQSAADQPTWTLLSSKTGDLPSPGASQYQPAALLFDVNLDGLNDFVITSRRDPGPSVIWYQRSETGWQRHVIEPDVFRIEAGGAFHDIDGDGDQDVVFGSENGSNEIWWWENPLPNGDPTEPWSRRLIKNTGSCCHHDMAFGDVDGDEKDEFVFWNQGANTLYVAEMPADPKQTEPWLNVTTSANATVVWRDAAVRYEGVAINDVDLDGTDDIIAGGQWFKIQPNGSYEGFPVDIQDQSRIVSGQLIPGGRPEIVQVPGDRTGMARWYRWTGSAWQGGDLVFVKNAHSLALGDVNLDGHLDIFMAEMRFAQSHNKHNPAARTWVFYGDGQGNFTEAVLATGLGNHESRLGDLDGDGDLDILVKPWTYDTPRVDVLRNELIDSGEPPICRPGEWDRKVIGDSGDHRNVLVDTADLDGDGDLDIVTGDQWYRNPGGSGSWQAQPVGGAFNQFAAAHDFDGDSDIDLLGTVSNNATLTQRGSAFVWARNDGSGTFTILNNIAAGTGDFLQGVVVETFNGATTVVLSWHSSSAGLQALTVPANPVTTTWPISQLSATTQSEDLSRGDIDRDGDTDLLLGTIWLRNQGGGQWNNFDLFTPAGNPDRNELADINGDGRLDAVVGYEAVNTEGVLAWYEAPTNPTQLWTERVIATIIGPMSVGVADFDGDGDLDVAAGEHDKNHPEDANLYLFENVNGDGRTWRDSIIYTGDEHHDGLEVTDIDGDGDLDLVGIGWTHGRVHVYVNNSCGVVVPPTPTKTPNPPATNTPEPPTPTATPEEGTETPTPTATAEESTETPTPTATAEESTETPTPAAPATATSTVSPSPEPDPPAATRLLVSSTTDGEVGGITFADEDILAFDLTTDTWSLYFDGSDVDLGAADIDALAVLTDGRLLLSTEAPVTLPTLGTVDDSDIIVFTPTSLGADTAGAFDMLLKGSDFGLSTNGEDIDAIGLMANGDLLISVIGKANASGVIALDEDIIRVPVSAGGQPTGNWTLYFDGSDLALSDSSEDINGVWLDVVNNSLHLSTSGNFKAVGLRGKYADIFACVEHTPGNDTECLGGLTTAWSGELYGFGTEHIDAISFADDTAPVPDPVESPTPTDTATATATATAGTPTHTPTVTPTATAIATASPPTATPPTSGDAWAFSDRRFRHTITVNAGPHARQDKPVAVPLNFGQLLGATGAGGVFDPNSIAVAEATGNGAILTTAVPFQFDAGAAAEGTLVLMLTGNTPAATSRHFQIYFDTTAAAAVPVSVPAWLSLLPNAQDEGFDSYRITTVAGTYDYHTRGGGFSSLVDAGNNDWIGWNSASGAAGDYRGIPNLVYPSDGGHFHPGTLSSTSQIVHEGPLRVTIRSTAGAGTWEALWEIYPTYARMTVVRAAATYWFLYEGTPGGLLESGDQVVRSTGTTTSATGSWDGDIPGEEWVYFSDSALDRSLWVAHEEGDTLSDSYRSDTNNNMTIFGFGRSRNNRYLVNTPQHFLFGLVEATGFNEVAAAVRSAYQPVIITAGAVDTHPLP